MRCVLIAAVIALAAPIVGATDDPEPERIGLVLSGGGALGAAHVGVLKVLEELRVPIHCVTGTSMGAVVGGMFAAGYTADELEALLLAIDWSDLLDDRPDRRRVPYRRKQDDLTYLTRLEIGFNGGRFQLPSALVTGQKLDFLLQALAVHTVRVDRFDDLPIPFRTVATDLETGSEVVLESGDLARAIRASMAVPGMFRPVEIDGRLLVDGGLVNNLPVDLARAMGADVVIAVDVGEPLRTRDRLRSLTGITGQVVSMITRGNVDRQAPNADLIIHPLVDEFSTTDFAKARKMIPLGEQAARAVKDQLERYSVSEQRYRTFRSRLQVRDVAEPIVVSVQVALSSNADPDLLLRRIRTRPGDALDIQAIARDLERLYALGDYELVSFYLTAEQGGYGLRIEAHEKSWGPHTMRFGLNLFSDFEGTGDFNLLANYTMTRLNRLRAEAKFSLQVGNEPRMTAEFYQPLHGRGRVFVAPYADVSKDRFGDVKMDSLTAGLDVGLSLGRFGEVRIGATRGAVRQRTDESGPGGFHVDEEWGGVLVRGTIDQIDNPNFPREGYLVSLSLLSTSERFGSDADYERLEWGLLAASSWRAHTLMAWLKGGDALGSDLPEYGWFELGGLFNLSGYRPRSIAGRYAAVGVLSYYSRLVELDTTLIEAVYGGFSIEAGNAWQERSAAKLDDLLWSGSLYLGVDSYFGPLYLAYGRAEDGNDSLYLFLGRSF